MHTALKPLNRRRFLKGATFLAMPCGVFSAETSISASSPKLGQLLITGFRGTHATDPEVERLRLYIENGDVAGVILLERNIVNPEQLSTLISALQDSSSEAPIIVAVDQEGGEVIRLRPNRGFLPWQPAATIARTGWDDIDIYNYYLERAEELAELGINLNLAPVVDLNINAFNPIIGLKGRSYGRDVQRVIRFAELFIKAHRASGVKTCLKHFPGHGSSMDDSHLGSADVTKSWQTEEISPFERLARAALADTIMNAHILHKYLSDEPWMPTSLSSKSVREIRDGLKFQGPVITDDMQMGAVTDFISAAAASVPAVRAGNSLLIYSNFFDRYSIDTVDEVRNFLQLAIEDGTLSTENILASTLVVETFRASLINPL